MVEILKCLFLQFVCVELQEGWSFIIWDLMGCCELEHGHLIDESVGLDLRLG